MAPRIRALFVHPVKACRAIPLPRACVGARGVRHDRRWMFVDAEGAMLTQRTHPQLARVQVSLHEDENALVLALTGSPLPPLRVALDAPPPGSPRRRVIVWDDETEGVDLGAEPARWATAALGEPAAMVFMPDEIERPVDPRYGGPGDVVGFADGYPLLLASISSLDDLNARLAPGPPVGMDRFRPNVVLDGFEPWAEDGWTRLRLGDLPVRTVKPCARCVVTTTDQQTGERGPEPLRTLATFRNRDGKVMFAVNAIPDAAGTLAVGDPVTVLA